MPPDVALIGPYPQSGRRHAGASGVASYTANLAHALAATGLTPVVIAPEHDGEPTVSDDGPVRIERRYRRGRTALVQAARTALATGAATVHLQFELFLYGGPATLAGLGPALVLLRARGAGPVVTMHQVLDPATIDGRTTRLHRVGAPPWAARLGLRGVSQVIGRLSSATIVHEQPFRRLVRGAVVIPHGIEHVAAPRRDEARDLLGLDARLTVLCFGFVAPYKGLEQALTAVEPIADRVNLVIAGGEHPRLVASEPYAATLQQRWDGIARFTGWVPEGDVGRWFAAADLALFPYPQPFASSGALALALSHRTPVLLSSPLAACLGAPDDLVVSSDPTELRARMLELVDRPDELKQLARWADALVEDRSWPMVAADHARLYEEVSHAGRAGRRVLRAG